MKSKLEPSRRIDVFTPEEVQRAAEIMREEELGRLVSRLKNEIVTEEVMARIDRETGQENDRRYMAYRLEWVAGERHGRT